MAFVVFISMHLRKSQEQGKKEKGKAVKGSQQRSTSSLQRGNSLSVGSAQCN